MSTSTGPTDNGDDRVDALEAQVRALQEEVRALRRAVEGERAGAEAAAVTAPSAAATPARPKVVDPAPPAEPVPDRAGSQARKPRAAWRDLDLEALIGGRWLNRIGILTLLIAAGFFLRYAFENEWIGPTGRVLIGLVSGLALAGYGEWLARRGMRYFAEGMTALGAGVVYLSGYAAWDFYELVPQPAAFAFLALVTAAVIGLSVRRDSQRLAALALAGGYLTPALLSTGTDAQVVLFSYLALLSASLLALALLRGFRGSGAGRPGRHGRLLCCLVCGVLRGRAASLDRSLRHALLCRVHGASSCPRTPRAPSAPERDQRAGAGARPSTCCCCNSFSTMSTAGG